MKGVRSRSSAPGALLAGVLARRCPRGSSFLQLLAACALLGASRRLRLVPVSVDHREDQTEEQKVETQRADFAKCLREDGVDADVRSSPCGGHPVEIKAPSRATLEAAEKACPRYEPGEPTVGEPLPQQKAEREEAKQRFAKCMREHGSQAEVVHVGGVHGESGVRIKIPGKRGANPEERPALQKAQQACLRLEPKPPGATASG